MCHSEIHRFERSDAIDIGDRIMFTENNGSLAITKNFFHNETHYVSARTGPSSGMCFPPGIATYIGPLGYHSD